MSYLGYMERSARLTPDAGAELTTWIWQIARNRGIDWFRKQKGLSRRLHWTKTPGTNQIARASMSGSEVAFQIETPQAKLSLNQST
jgi:DNA-directed RNA polymerase specialized sigma24 family protein